MKVYLAAFLTIFVFSIDSYSINFQQRFRSTDRILFSQETDETEIYERLKTAFRKSLTDNNVTITFDANDLLTEVLKGAAARLYLDGADALTINQAVLDISRMVKKLKTNSSKNSSNEDIITRKTLLSTLTNNDKMRLRLCPFYPFC